jgi:type II secretory pathway pseudopilin PulG
MVALTIIALLAAIISPNLGRRKPEYARQQFLGHLNALIRLAAQQAAVTRKVHRVYFDYEKYKVAVQVKGEGKDEKGEQLYKLLKAPYLHSVLTWPKHFDVLEFKIEGTNEKISGKNKFWFFIVPEGLAQDVTINMLDKNKAYRGKNKKIGLVLNPFSAQFKIYESFQK